MRVLQRMSFRSKILSVLLLITLVFSVFSLILVSSIGSISKLTNTIKDENIPELVWLSYWEKELDIKEYMVESYMINDFCCGFIESYQKNELENNKEMIDQYGTIPKSMRMFETEIDLIDFIIINEVNGLLAYGDTDAAKEVIEQQFIPKVTDLRQKIMKEKENEFANLDVNTGSFPVIIKRSLLLLLVLLLSSVILSIFASYRISAGLTKPIESMILKVNQIANGEYGLTVNKAKQTELQQLATSINVMSVHLENSFQQISADKVKREQIINSLPVGIITYDQETTTYHMNTSAQMFLAMDEEKINLLDKKQVKHLNPKFWDVLFSGKSCTNERVVYEFVSGGMYQLLLSQTDLLDHKQGIIGRIFYFIDVTEIESLQNRIHQSEKLALVGEMAATSAHEIRNPLSVIYGFISLMNKTINKEDKDRFHIPLLMKELDRLNAIVEEMLMVAKPGQPERKEVLIQDIFDDILPLINKSSSSILIDFDIKLSPIAIKVDEKQMKQVFLNFIRNSIEALEGEGTIFIYSKTQDDYYNIYIQDNGPGIPSNIVHTLFEPFSSSKENGTGLGLNIVKRIVRNHGGKVELLSSNDAGTTFLVQLPL